MLCLELMETVSGGKIALQLLVILLVLSPSIGFANGEGNSQDGKNKDWHTMVSGELRECSMCSPHKEGCEECVRNPHCYHCFLRLARVYRTPLKPHARGLSRQLSAKIIGGLSALLFLVFVCGPLCCLCCAVRRVRAIRAKAASSRSLMFTVQWRSLNAFRPFKDDEEELEEGGRTWAAWEFSYTEIPDHLNGLSTAVFQSTLPILKPITSTNPLQEIRLNPGCCHHRREQSIQCRLPLTLQQPNLLPNVSYFEITIVAFWRKENRARSQGSLRGTVAIGLAARPAPPFRLPGKDPISVGYHSNKGKLFVSDFTDQGCRFGSRWNYVGATVGCGYDLNRRVVFFTHVGHNRGEPLFTEFGIGDGVATPHLFPVIGADCDVTMLVNFGEAEFKFCSANLSRCSITQELNTLNQVVENLPEAIPEANETAAIVHNGMTKQDAYNLVVQAHAPMPSEEALLSPQSPKSPIEVSCVGQLSAASEEKAWEAPSITSQTDA
ncbi:hypothetical protein O6H91_18G063300 [Diphasiastrum complanatum]|uniref:Uncharacterized protein n=1 Tax=Diphasiastrum complanatum TaxID=34168 RepID=A0ACC2B200_DIPCM|nr:hypothetical protein O6H91_18G063300 [Diphasiastrum complanatum]